jgi:hypothetical protein
MKKGHAGTMTHDYKRYGTTTLFAALMVGRRVQRASFEARVVALVADDPLLAGTTGCMLRCWAVLWTEYKRYMRCSFSWSAGMNSVDASAVSRCRAGDGADVQGGD